MNLIRENENLFATPSSVNLKNKRVAFSSSKNRTKTALADLGSNTFQERRRDVSETVTPCKSSLSVEHLRKSFKSPKRVTGESGESLAHIDDHADDFIFTSCRCSSDLSDDNFWKLPEELSLTKNEIDVFATKWRNDSEIGDEKFLASSPIKIDQDVFDSFIPTTYRSSESFLDLLNESYEVIPPELPF